MASERDEEVQARVRELLQKYPDLDSRQLYDMATRMKPSLYKLPLRNFHARYVLPIRREMARAEGRGVRKAAEKKVTTPRRARGARKNAERAGRQEQTTAAGDNAHARVREILLRYVREIAGAETRTELVDLVGGVDAVVNEILGAR